MSDYFDLGTYSRPVSTDSPEAQLWFDRGLNWCYGYNYEEAQARLNFAQAHADVPIHASCYCRGEKSCCH